MSDRSPAAAASCKEGSLVAIAFLDERRVRPELGDGVFAQRGIARCRHQGEEARMDRWRSREARPQDWALKKLQAPRATSRQAKQGHGLVESELFLP